MNAWKHYLLWIGFLGITTGLFAQVPQGINYQGIARVNGSIWTNQTFLVRFTVFSDPGGTNLVYMESHNVTSNQYGLFTAVIGNGIPSTGTFAAIDWGNSDHALQVEIDDGSGYVVLGLKQLQAVPYAFSANKASQMVMSDLIDVDTTGLNPGQVLKWNGTAWVPQNDSVNTQLLSVSGNQLSISSGNTVLIPGATYTAGSGIDITGTIITNTGDLDASDDITIGSTTGGDLVGTYPNPLVDGIWGRPISNATPNNGEVYKWNQTAMQWQLSDDEVNDLDANPVNELQTLSIMGSDLTLSNGGGTVTLPFSSVYTAGPGIDISGNIITNTGDTNATDDITISSAAGGDLTGLYPNPSVSQIRGNNVANVTPLAGQVLKYSGTQWEPQPDLIDDADNDPSNEIQLLSLSGSSLALSNGGGVVNLPVYTGGAGIDIIGSVIINTGDSDPSDDITVTTTAGGDLTGIYPNPTVSALAGNPVSSFPPSPNQVLKWDGSQWYPGQDSSQNVWDVIGPNISYTNGNVGIGVFNPNARLEVAGNQNIVNNSGEKRVETSIISDEGFIGVYDSNNVLKAGIQIDGTGQGEIFGDVKNFRVPHPNDVDKEIWYASLEGPEAAAYARGTATLVNGEVSVSFPEHYQLISSGEGITILLTPLSADSEGLAVIEKGAEGFTVKELRKGKGNYSFDWEVKCIRKGHEDYQIIRPRK